MSIGIPECSEVLYTMDIVQILSPDLSSEVIA